MNQLTMAGTLDVRKIPNPNLKSLTIVKDIWIPEEVSRYDPKSELGQYVKSILHFLPPEQALELIDRISSVVVFESSLAVRHFRNGKLYEDKGIVGRKVITDSGVAYMVDQFQGLAGKDLEKFKYHGVGTGVTAESQTQTALVTESTTILNPDSTRPTGTQTEGATANIYKTVGTIAFDGSGTITEHGLFDQAATGGGTMWDRTLFASSSGVGSGDSLETIYQLTINAGG